jgi:hypothetical protein
MWLLLSYLSVGALVSAGICGLFQFALSPGIAVGALVGMLSYWAHVAQLRRRQYHRAYRRWSGWASSNLHIFRTDDGAGWTCPILGLHGNTQQTACGAGYQSAIFDTRKNTRISFTFHPDEHRATGQVSVFVFTRALRRGQL